MEFRFDGKKALVTGAGKGIGRAVAVALWSGGAETYAVSRTQADLDSLKAECPGIHTICLDVCHFEETREAIEKVGCFNLLVNNAGLGSGVPFLEATLEEYDLVMNTNAKSVLNISQTVARDMVNRKCKGAIVNVSSHASQRALPGHVLYGASKGALDQMTRCMALELGSHGIRVNSVNPTVTMTDMGRQHWSAPERKDPLLARIPMHEFAEVQDVVRPILYLLSDKANMINGAFLPIDGGLWCI